MSFTVLVPARMASSRLPGKPLADIAGVPMIVRVAQRAALSGAQRVVVAADHADIVSACVAHGVGEASGASSERASASSITGMPSRTGNARPSARQTSSTCGCIGGRRCSSGPLQIGQTSRSSRRVSMGRCLVRSLGRWQQGEQRGIEHRVECEV